MGGSVLSDPVSAARVFNDLAAELCRLFVDKFKAPQTVAAKEGNELVGELDRAADAECARVIRKFFGDALIVSEESNPAWPCDAPEYWLVDPFDGTHNFLMGLPLCGTMAAHVYEGVVDFAAVLLPLERRFGRTGVYLALRGKGAWELAAAGHLAPIKVSSRTNLAEAFLLLEGPSRGLEDSAFAGRLKRACRRNRVNLGAAVSGVLVASGGLMPAGADIVVTVNNKPWDNLPIALLIEEAGGRVTDHAGQPWSTVNYANLVMSNGRVHDAALERGVLTEKGDDRVLGTPAAP